MRQDIPARYTSRSWCFCKSVLASGCSFWVSCTLLLCVSLGSQTGWVICASPCGLSMTTGCPESLDRLHMLIIAHELCNSGLLCLGASWIPLLPRSPAGCLVQSISVPDVWVSCTAVEHWTCWELDGTGWEEGSVSVPWVWGSGVAMEQGRDLDGTGWREGSISVPWVWGSGVAMEQGWNLDGTGWEGSISVPWVWRSGVAIEQGWDLVTQAEEKSPSLLLGNRSHRVLRAGL